MADRTGGKESKKGFFSRMLDKLDKKLEKLAKKSKCCDSGNGKGRSCCS